MEDLNSIIIHNPGNDINVLPESILEIPIFNNTDNDKEVVDKKKKVNKRKRLEKIYNGWSKQKQKTSKKWINKLHYEAAVSYFFVNNLKWYEGTWSWTIIVISTITSALSLVQINDDNSYPQVKAVLSGCLSGAAIITTLLAAWIKKQHYAERIQETDRYLQKVNRLTTECNHILSKAPYDRISYEKYVDEYQQRIVTLLSTIVPMSPEEYKKAVFLITKYYPEVVIEVWPWYDKKETKDQKTYYQMTDFGKNILESYKQIKYRSCFLKLICCYYCRSKCCDTTPSCVFYNPIEYNNHIREIMGLPLLPKPKIN